MRADEVKQAIIENFKNFDNGDFTSAEFKKVMFDNTPYYLVSDTVAAGAFVTLNVAINKSGICLSVVIADDEDEEFIEDIECEYNVRINACELN